MPTDSFTLSPPGAIGLPRAHVDNLLLLRLDEVDSALRPADAMGNLGDLGIEAGLTMPAVVDAALGRGRQFVSSATTGLLAKDVVAGSTLATRDLSIQVVMSWDLAAQTLSGESGTIYARGRGGSAAEYYSAILALDPLSPTTGEVRLHWTVGGGTDFSANGAEFVVPAGFFMLTTTRRWVNSETVVTRHYLGDRLLLETTTDEGAIDGGTTGTTTIGARHDGTWQDFFDGTIDELRVVGYELTLEEIASTWQRITYHQPRGYQLVREMHDPGFPIAQDPASRAQRETRMWGHALGYAVAEAENLRNLLPHRAYGEALTEWETIVKESPKPRDSTDQRRARVVGRMQQNAGVSIPGIGQALEELLDTDASNLEVFSFTHDTVDDFAAAGTALNPLRWYYEPAADWTISGNSLRAQADGITASVFTGSVRDWKTARMSIGGNGREVKLLAKITTAALPASGEVGLWVGDRAVGNFLLVGIRNVAGTRTLVSERFKLWVSQGLLAHGTTTGVPHWLRFRWSDDDSFFGLIDEAPYRLEWSTVGEGGPWTASGLIIGPNVVQWAGLHLRSPAGGGASDVSFDDVRTRAPYGDRALRFYVYRDPGLSGSPDILGANNVLQALKQAHTEGAVITSEIALYGDASAGYGGPPMGGI